MAVKISQAVTAKPELGTPAAETFYDAARSIVFVNIEGGIVGGRPVAHVHPRVNFGEIFESHPERSVVGIHLLHLLLDARMFVPLLGLIRPRPLPFESSPGISQLQQLERGTGPGHHAVAHLPSLDDAVGVAGDEPLALQHLLPARPVRLAIIHLADGGGHKGLLPVVLLEERPELFVRVLLLRLPEAARALVILVVDGDHVLALPAFLHAFLFVFLLFVFLLAHLKHIIAGEGMPSPEDEASVEGGIAAAKFGVSLL
mmetsp:Transcript_5864/g.14679  ORF Transcript_5864/g.14679 Transcript_5864/m.14679 type:complete len:258 (-) Transcript_5864:418-1191(-)